MRAVMVVAALISDSPVVSWQTEPSFRQCTSGKRGEKPGMVMFLASRSPIDPLVLAFVYQMSASGENCRGSVNILIARLETYHRNDEHFRCDDIGIFVDDSDIS